MKKIWLAPILMGMMMAPSMGLASESTSLRVMVVLKEDMSKPNPLDDPKKSKLKTDKQSEARRLKRKQLAQTVAKRIKRRLFAAGVKSATVKPGLHGEIAINVIGKKYTKSWLESIVVPPGQLGIHPRVDAGDWWKDLTSDLPKGVRLRQPRGQDASQAYLWSTDDKVLRGYLKRITLPDVRLGVLPHKKGWRSVVYKAPVLNEAYLNQASAVTSKTGRPFVALTFKNKAQTVWAKQTAKQYVVVLDGEVLSSMGKPSATTNLQLKLMCPGIQLIKAQRTCVRQITGRLAAPIPIRLVTLKEKTTSP